MSLDIIGKAIFNYDFGSVTNESPVIQSVYSVLKEAEHRSTTPAPYWEIPLANQARRKKTSYWSVRVDESGRCILAGCGWVLCRVSDANILALLLSCMLLLVCVRCL